jgi:uncharacterized surface protein with fasciclin (FAS1) repeats
MSRTRTGKAPVLAACAVAVLGVTGCSTGTHVGQANGIKATPLTTPLSGPAGGDPTANLVGTGCQTYARQVPSGAGSMQSMATDSVSVAAGHNPKLTTWVRAVSGRLNPRVDLVRTLDGSQFTIFAPIDSAFARLPASTLTTLAEPANASTLQAMIMYHVVFGQLQPSAVDGSHKTAEGDAVVVTGAGDDLKVNGASVICGGMRTANATVYLIDSVLTPPSH